MFTYYVVRLQKGTRRARKRILSGDIDREPPENVSRDFRLYPFTDVAHVIISLYMRVNTCIQVLFDFYLYYYYYFFFF
jgi:hypothetical protein